MVLLKMETERSKGAEAESREEETWLHARVPGGRLSAISSPRLAHVFKPALSVSRLGSF